MAVHASEITHVRASWVLPLLTALVAVGLGQITPALSPLLLAMLLGVVAANSMGAGHLELWCSPTAARTMLRWGIVLLGFRLSVGQLAELGARGLVVVVATVLTTYLSTLWLGRRLGVAEDLTQLIAAGFSICGAAAVATVQDGVRAAQRHVALALALVALFGTAMIGFVPLASRALGLSAAQSGVWAGASIHEVAQVVAAGALLGPTAMAAAVTVKLGRVLMLAPVHFLSVRTSTRESAGVPVLPWFVIGFLIAVATRSAVHLPTDVLAAVDVCATVLLAAGMFGLGSGILVRDLFPLPLRSVVLATAATAVVTSVPLAGVLLLW